MNLIVLLLLGVFTVSLYAQKVYEGNFHQTLRAEDYGDAANAAIKDLYVLAAQYFSIFCQQHGRDPNCFKWVDVRAERDGNWP